MKLFLGLADFPLLLLEELKDRLKMFPETTIVQKGFDIEVHCEGSPLTCAEVIAIVEEYSFKPQT